MTTFKDKQNREWNLTLDAPTIKSVRQKFGINLTNLAEDPLENLAENPLLLVDVIWEICRTQAETRNVNEDDFGRAIDLGVAAESLVDAVVDFFPRGKQLQTRSKLDKARTIREQEVTRQLDRMDTPEVRELIRKRSDAEFKRTILSMENTDQETSPEPKSAGSSTGY